MQLRHRLALCAIALLTGAAASPPAPVLTSGSIVSTTVDVSKPPPAPIIQLGIKGLTNQITFSWTGPSGENFNQWFVGGAWNGNTVFQAYNAPSPPSGFDLAFGPYTEPGTWTLSYINVCNQMLACTSYSGTTLAALFGRVTITIANPNPYDIAPPVAVSANLQTPTLSLSKDQPLRIAMAAKDNLSGIAYAFVCASTPSVFQQICANFGPATSIITAKRLELSGSLPTSTVTGAYTIDNVYLSDVAGNTDYITDNAAISKLFKGNITITVTN